MFAPIVAALALLGSVQAFTYTVTVGIDETDGQQGIGFDPSAIRPAAGDTITFTFAMPEYIKSPQTVQHSATQSTFDNPCSSKAGGFDTGVQSTGSANTNTGSSFSLTVNDTEPLWFFSSVGSDCKSGMVLAVNPPLTGDNTAAAFKEKAMSSTGSSTPATSESASVSASASQSTSGAGQTSGSTSPSDTAAAQPSTTSNAAVSTRAKIELCFAGVVALMGVMVAA